jgi:hypothetical protein
MPRSSSSSGGRGDHELPDDVPPPWEGPTGTLHQMRVSGVAFELVAFAREQLGLSTGKVMDLLLRTFTPGELVERVREQQVRDGVARAAWVRTRWR